MTGLLTLSQEILCKGEVLGQDFHAVIANIPVAICFPEFSLTEEKEKEALQVDKLQAPTIAKTWKRGQKSLYWGYPMQLPSGNSCVNLLAISTECEESQVEEKAKILYGAIEKWTHAFVSYLMISTKQNTERDRNIPKEKACELELLGKQYIPKEVGDVFYFSIVDKNRFASKEQIEQAITFANTGKELLLEYQMMLSAYSARRHYQNRQAIVDACSAVELRLVNNIEKSLNALNLNPKFFLDKYASLGSRFELIKQLDKSFPADDFQGIIVKPRNDIAHNREAYPDDKTTDRLISCVESCLAYSHMGFY